MNTTAHLTDRQQDVLTRIALGRSHAVIAAELHLSTKTVDNHASAVYRALGITNVADATRAAIARELVTMPTMERDSVARERA